MKHELEPAEFWELRARSAEAQRAADAVRMTTSAAREVGLKQDVVFKRLAAKYGFDQSAQTFVLDDETLTLTLPDIRAADKSAL